TVSPGEHLNLRLRRPQTRRLSSSIIICRSSAIDRADGVGLLPSRPTASGVSACSAVSAFNVKGRNGHFGSLCELCDLCGEFQIAFITDQMPSVSNAPAIASTA